MNRGRITWNIRGVLQVYDSFTARPANLSHLRVLTEEEIRVIKKEGGILVFAENSGKNEKNSVWVRLESPIFLPEEIRLSPSANPLPRCIRLRPSKAYPAPSRTGIVYGYCAPGAELFFVFDALRTGAGEGNEKKLLNDIVPGTETVKLYHPGRRSLEGEWIELTYGRCRERLYLGQMNAEEQERPDTGEYRICGQTAESYPRLETALRLVYFTRADAQGEYCFYFRQVPEGMARGRICVQDGRAEQEVTVLQGKSVRLDIDGSPQKADHESLMK